jgi:hypothetical protein
VRFVGAAFVAGVNMVEKSARQHNIPDQDNRSFLARMLFTGAAVQWFETIARTSRTFRARTTREQPPGRRFPALHQIDATSARSPATAGYQ